MAPFLYFLPTLTREQLFPKGRLQRSLLAAPEAGAAAHLLDVLSDVESLDDVGATSVARGPTGSSGTIVVALPNDRARHHEQFYHADQQTWQPLEAGSAPSTLWIGVDNGHPPEPDDLARRGLHKGYAVPLGDGHSWTVPVIRRPAICTRYGLPLTELPRDFVIRADGSIEEKLQRRYEAAWEATGAVADVFFTPEGVLTDNPRCELGWAIAQCLAILAINYRIGREEHNLLRLLNSENWAGVLACAVDQPSVLAVQEALAQKKSERAPSPPATANSPTGAPDATPTTDRAAEICT